MSQSATATGKPAARRRATRLLCLALVLLTLALALPARASAFIASGDDGWVKQSLGTTSSLSAVAFTDAARGWAVSYGGTIFATTDGGATWSSQSSGTTEWLLGVAFTDAAHGWAVGTGGVILATTNGGATWSKKSSPTAHLMAVAFPDAAHGWAVGYAGVILATTDGGATWSAQSSRTTEYLNAVSFNDTTHGWAVGPYGVIRATTNGGWTWSAQSSRTTASLNDVTFTDATHGWAVGGAVDQATQISTGVILATTDGGGPPVKARYKVTPPAVPPRVRAGARVESWGAVKPALKSGDRIVVFWEHYIGGRWDMVLARKPADSYRTTALSTRYSVRMVFKPGKWRVRATAGAHEPVTSAVRTFTAY